MSANEQSLPGQGAQQQQKENSRNDKDKAKQQQTGKKSTYRTTLFKGANEDIATLCTKAERRQKDQYVVFQKSLEQHVTTNFTNPGDILPAVQNLIDPMTELMKDLPRKETVHNYLYGSDTSPPITQPPTPVPDNITSGEGGDNSQVSPDIKIKSEGDSIDKELEESLNSLYKEEIKMFASRKNMLRQNQIKLWGVVWGQCSPALQTEVKGDDGFVTALGKYNIVWLLTRLKLTAAGIDRSVSPYMALVNSITFFHTLRQQRDESIENYRRRFESA